MRRPLTFGVIFGMATFLSFAPDAHAQTADMRWEALSESERGLIDRLAADFYEDGLRQAQSDAIETRTNEIYREAQPADRARYREDRRSDWEAMSDAQRGSLRGVKRPVYRNLTEEQKAPFRRGALDRLGGAGALDADAIADTLKNDI